MINKKKKPRFLRKDTFKISSIGKRRRKKQKWRRARGRHSKIRRKEKGYGKEPGIGYSSPRKIRGFIDGLKPIRIANMRELNKVKEGNIIILSRTLGKRKRDEIMKIIKEKNMKVLNPK